MNSIVTTQRGGVKFSWVSQILFTRLYQGPRMHVCVRGLVARGVRQGPGGAHATNQSHGTDQVHYRPDQHAPLGGVHTQCTLTCVTNRTRIPLERRTDERARQSGASLLSAMAAIWRCHIPTTSEDCKGARAESDDVRSCGSLRWAGSTSKYSFDSSLSGNTSTQPFRTHECGS